FRQATRDLEEGVDSRIASEEYPLDRHALRAQPVAGSRGGSEERRGQQIDRAPIRLLGKRMLKVAAAQSGLDVADANAEGMAVVVSPCTSSQSGERSRSTPSRAVKARVARSLRLCSGRIRSRSRSGRRSKRSCT